MYDDVKISSLSFSDAFLCACVFCAENFRVKMNSRKQKSVSFAYLFLVLLQHFSQHVVEFKKKTNKTNNKTALI